MGVKLRKRKKKVNEGFQMGGASPIGTFSGGYNPQGSTVFNNPAPFSYEVISLNASLSQRGNSTPNEIMINRGMRIKGYGLDDKKEYIGRIDTIVKDSDGYIKYVIILDENERKFVKIDSDEIYLLK